VIYLPFFSSPLLLGVEYGASKHFQKPNEMLTVLSIVIRTRMNAIVHAVSVQTLPDDAAAHLVAS
jgi:hypothetical protein